MVLTGLLGPSSLHDVAEIRFHKEAFGCGALGRQIVDMLSQCLNLHIEPVAAHSAPGASHLAPDAAQFAPDATHFAPDVVHYAPKAAHFAPDVMHFAPDVAPVLTQFVSDVAKFEICMNCACALRAVR